jgi:hypothetical protein
LDAVGGKLDPTLHYKLTNRQTTLLLGGSASSVGTGILSLLPGLDGIVGAQSQWTIASDNNGAFTIANVFASESGHPVVLDATSAQNVTQTTANGSQSQSWDVQTAGNGYFYLVNQATGLVLGANAQGHAVEQSQSGAGSTAQWQITPVSVLTTR